MKLCVLIPVYNEAENIGPLVEGLKKRGKEVVVINDGSTDGSGLIAQAKNAVVLSHVHRAGKGTSLRDGFDYAIQHNYDGVITMDGDGQHDIEDLEKIAEKAKEIKSGIVTGSRMKNHRDMPWLRFLVNKAMSSMISFVCRQKIADTQCGFRFISTDILKSLHLSCSDYEIESEVLIQSAKKGFKIISVPIKTIYGAESSKINPLVDTIRFFKYIIRELWT